MYQQSESELEKPSLEVSKQKSTALINFLRSLDEDFVAEMGEYLQKNKSDKKNDHRKISLYQDIELIYRIKIGLDDNQLNNVRYRSDRVKEVINQFRNGRSLPTLTERINKLLSKLTPDIIRTHMKAKADFNFKGKNYVPMNVSSGPSKNKSINEESKIKNQPKSKPVINEVKKEERQMVQNVSIFRTRQEGKQSVQSKNEVSVDTDYNGKSSPARQGVIDWIDRIYCVYNPRNKNLQFIKKQKKEETIFEEKADLENSKKISTEKESVEIIDNPTSYDKNNQVQDQNEDLESKIAHTRQKLKQSDQTFNSIINSPQRPNKQHNKQNEPNTEAELKDSELLLNNLKYQLSNNQQYFKQLQNNADLRSKLCFSRQEDEGLIKFNENPQERDHRLFVYCLLKYKSLELIEERLRFLKVEINEAIYPAIKEVEAKKLEVIQ